MLCELAKFPQQKQALRIQMPSWAAEARRRHADNVALSKIIAAHSMLSETWSHPCSDSQATPKETQ